MQMSITPKLPPVPPLDANAQLAALDRQRQLAKPPGSLGRLEVLSAQLAGMTGNLDWFPHQRAVIICAGDHGVAERHNVSPHPRRMTKQRVQLILAEQAPINALIRQSEVDFWVVDAGVAGILPESERLIAEKISYGTADMTIGPAMPPGNTDRALTLGLQIAEYLVANGANLLVVGDVGVGNTVAAIALVAALTNRAPAEIIGGNLGKQRNRLEVIEKALTVNQPMDVDSLAKFGGYEISTLVGLIVGAAAARVPVVLDGLVTVAAALAATMLDANTINYLVAGHRSEEPGQGQMLALLGLRPVLDLNLQLGEGCGAVLAVPLIESAMRVLQDTASN